MEGTYLRAGLSFRLASRTLRPDRCARLGCRSENVSPRHALAHAGAPKRSPRLIDAGDLACATRSGGLRGGVPGPRRPGLPVSLPLAVPHLRLRGGASAAHPPASIRLWGSSSSALIVASGLVPGGAGGDLAPEPARRAGRWREFSSSRRGRRSPCCGSASDHRSEATRDENWMRFLVLPPPRSSSPPASVALTLPCTRPANAFWSTGGAGASISAGDGLFRRMAIVVASYLVRRRGRTPPRGVRRPRRGSAWWEFFGCVLDLSGDGDVRRIDGTRDG